MDGANVQSLTSAVRFSYAGCPLLALSRQSRYPSHQETHRRTRFASSWVSSGGSPKRLQLRASSLALSSTASVGIDAPVSKMKVRAILLNIGSLHPLRPDIIREGLY